MAIGELQTDNEQQHFAHLFSHMPNAVCIVKLTTKQITYVNAEFEMLFAYKAKVLINQPFQTLPIDANSQLITNIEEHLVKHRKWQGQLKCLKKDGTPFWSKSDVSIYEHPQYGKYFIACFTDISEQILNQQELQASLNTINASINSSKDLAFLTVDKNYSYLFFNSIHANIIKSRYGITVRSGMSFLDCITDVNDQLKAKNYLDKALQGIRHTQIDLIKGNHSASYVTKT